MTFLNMPDPLSISQFLSKGIAFTLMNEVDIVACGGIVKFWNGVGEAWVVTSHKVNLYPLSFAKTVYRKLQEIINRMDLERVQTVVDVEHITSLKWVEWMGFKKEGLMRKYINGRDFYRYAWIKEN